MLSARNRFVRDVRYADLYARPYICAGQEAIGGLCYVVPSTRLYLAPMDEQLSPATDVYVNLHVGGLYGPSGTQMGVQVQICMQSKNWLACLIVPLTRLYFLSSLQQVSPATEV